MATTPKTYREAKQAGRVMGGEWGWAERGGGAIWCMPEDRQAVQAAYDAIEEGDLGPDVLAGVEQAGGVYVPDQE
jgi:hypothetical protein